MKRSLAIGILAFIPAFALAGGGGDWWDKAWTARKSFTVETGKDGADISVGIPNGVVLLRLHQGNFPFEQVREDGADIRAVSGDGSKELPLQVEKFDSLMYEAFAWVRLPEIAGNGPTSFFLYFGNPEPAAAGEQSVFEDSTVLVYHFAERSGTPPKDSSPAGNNAQTGGTASEGSLIGGGLRLLGADPIVIPASDSLKWNQGQDFSASIWAKRTTTTPRAILLSRMDGGSGWRLGLDNGVPFVEVVSGGSARRTPPGEPVTENAWHHLAMVAKSNEITLYVNGEPRGTLSAGLPAMQSPFALGGDPTTTAAGNGRFVGEVDELRMHKRALTPAEIAFDAVTQSTSEKAARVVVAGEDESRHGGGHNETLEHIMLFGDIAANMMFDGWIAVGVCILMMIGGGAVAAQKWMYLNKIEKGTQAFLRHWKNVASDLTALDLDNPAAAKDLGGKMDKKTLKLLKDSPLYHVYHIGAEEIRHRLGNGKNKGQGLSARSIQAIRAALDAGLVHEQHRLYKGIVILTTGIAGGPYVGLLGTVVGVMITFALIAKSGEVDVNSIAPGIASALLATTFGLLVAIPCLFLYNYLNTRMKDQLSAMQVFIDEFVAKIAEFYPPPGEAGVPVPVRQIRSDEDAQKFQAQLEKDGLAAAPAKI